MQRSVHSLTIKNSLLLVHTQTERMHRDLFFCFVFFTKLSDPAIKTRDKREINNAESSKVAPTINSTGCSKIHTVNRKYTTEYSGVAFMEEYCTFRGLNCSSPEMINSVRKRAEVKSLRMKTAYGQSATVEAHLCLTNIS